eukprot:TRINITY_DN67214_c0_g1_i1.p1 TRINITY_DN67214_c0_g1~~TRINITY_DN67214_c0_g1_i1.p1  ORF type:complete len:744 (-),score=121.29 TRINITY_DN67214_c0_g1_i1:123-2354(-)
MAKDLHQSGSDPLTIVNSLHQVLANAGLHADLGLPQIAVVGSQSVGKTSVLQSLVGRDFLPRGTGIVTRRPLVLQLRTTQASQRNKNDVGLDGVSTPRRSPGMCADDGCATDWAEFAHKLGERYTDFEQVSREIVAETNRLCGERQGVSDEPILLRIYSPNVMDLTLVDLPGLTKVPTGEQPANIAERIRSLVLKYISHQSCLILAVTAGNTDLATSDALALAREVDPAGERTVGVLTKLDLADESGNAVEALSGNVYPLSLGYVGVVCKTDMTKGQTFEQMLDAEEAFFRQSRTFRGVADQCGIPYLARRLHELLLNHIREGLHELRCSVQRAADECVRELASFGDVSMELRDGQGPFLLTLITSYVRNFADALEGRLAYSQQDAPPDRLVGGARLHYIFHRVFAQAVLNFDVFSGLSDKEIRIAMRNAAGPKPQLFVPEVAFENLVKRQIAKLEEPSMQCVHLVLEELKLLATQSEVAEMQRFHVLRERILEVALSVIRRCLRPTKQIVANLIRIELAHINVDHPDFIGGSKAMATVQSSGTHSTELGMQPQQLASLTQFLSDEAEGRESGQQIEPASEGSPQQLWGGGEGPGGCVGGKGAMGNPVMQLRRNRWGDFQRGPATEDPLRLPTVPLVVLPSGEPSEKERLDTDLLKSLVSSYFAIVRRKIIDAVPKTIMHFMVNAVRVALLHECITELYRTENFPILLQEADDTRQRREECKQKLTDLRQAQEILAKIRDTSM